MLKCHVHLYISINGVNDWYWINDDSEQITPIEATLEMILIWLTLTLLGRPHSKTIEQNWERKYLSVRKMLPSKFQQRIHKKAHIQASLCDLLSIIIHTIHFTRKSEWWMSFEENRKKTQSERIFQWNCLEIWNVVVLGVILLVMDLIKQWLGMVTLLTCKVITTVNHLENYFCLTNIWDFIMILIASLMNTTAYYIHKISNTVTCTK